MRQNTIRSFLLATLALSALAACDSSTPSPTPAPTVAVVATPVPSEPPTIGPTAEATTVPVVPTDAAATVGATVTANSADVVTIARALITQLADGDFKSAVANFDETMSKQLSADKMEATWKQITASVGAFQSQGQAQTAKQEPYDIIIIPCTFANAVLDAKVVLNAQHQVSGLFFTPSASATPQATRASNYTPPSYAKPDTFTERDLSFGSPEWVLTGTLTMPKGTGPFPAVLLVHGSGPNDRDETIGDNKPFKDLAWGLASQGIAVFRYDKRNFVYPAKLTAILDTITVKEEVVDDAVEALALLSKTEGIDPNRVFLAGHSLGAMLAPMIAKTALGERGFIALAAPARPLEDVALEQYNYIANLDGTVTPDEQAQLDALAQQVDNVKKLTPDSNMSPDQLPLGIPANYWLSLQGYDPVAAAKSLDEPMLILQGESDYQVTMTDFNLWRAAFEGNANATLKSYPGLNHLFIEGPSPSTPSDYDKPGHIAETVINDVASWIADH